jgi:outer membrane protein assembly factor BamD
VKKNNKLLFSSLFLFILFALGCSKYQKLLKSNDNSAKYEGAIKYYEKKDYQRAFPLLEELMPLYRGAEKGELIYYYYCNANYFLNDFYVAAYHYKKFYQTYPSSKYAEECLYMSAYCNYIVSPPFSLDQESTIKAIEEFQVFSSAFPTSTRIDTCNIFLDELNNKLETKYLEHAKLYYKTENYKAAIVSFQNFLKDFPVSDYKEDVLYLTFKSWYFLTKNSIPEKKSERIKETIEAYYNFVDVFPNSKKIKEAESLYKNITLEKTKVEQKKI